MLQDATFVRCLSHETPLILDGGLATELERHGHALDGKLWSAKLLDSGAASIQAVQKEFLHAGADVICSASYQASLPGFESAGFSRTQSIELLQRSIQLSKQARAEFASEFESNPQAASRVRPFVAASVGPFGAYLANGAEYTGAYGVALEDLLDFHQERWQIFLGQEPDLMLCETIPAVSEVKALTKLASQTAIPTVISLSCNDDLTLRDGTPIAEVAKMLNDSAVKCVGVNCISPNLAVKLLDCLGKVSQLPLAAYPNSGETYDVTAGNWLTAELIDEFQSASMRLHERGASMLGGCCRTTPAHISALRKVVSCTSE